MPDDEIGMDVAISLMMRTNQQIFPEGLMEHRVVYSFGDPPLRKHLSHLKRLRQHLTLFCDGEVPVLPESDSEKDACKKVDAFFMFVTSALPTSLASDVEVLQFLASSVPDPEAWQSASAPKVRKVTLDVEIINAFQLR